MNCRKRAPPNLLNTINWNSVPPCHSELPWPACPSVRGGQVTGAAGGLSPSNEIIAYSHLEPKQVDCNNDAINAKTHIIKFQN